MDMDIYKKIIKEKLTPKRYEHSIRVSEEAVKLAKKYGADSQKAEIAGILHDIMKDTDYDYLQSLLELTANSLRK